MFLVKARTHHRLFLDGCLLLVLTSSAASNLHWLTLLLRPRSEERQQQHSWSGHDVLRHTMADVLFATLQVPGTAQLEFALAQQQGVHLVNTANSGDNCALHVAVGASRYSTTF